MAAKTSQTKDQESIAGCFGFEPEESAAHFLVQIPASSAAHVEISEHFTWDPKQVEKSAHYGTDRDDGQVRCRVARVKWDRIADDLRVEFNNRLKREGKRSGRWKTGFNLINRMLGKEMTVLAWAMEDADPAVAPTAVANWLGLAPEERWWLYTMTAAATGHFNLGQGRGWRKALRFALTENPVIGRATMEPPVPEFFQLARAGQRTMFSETPAEPLGPATDPPTAPPRSEQSDEADVLAADAPSSASPVKKPARKRARKK